MDKKIIEELNQLKEDVFANAVRHGWHEDDKPEEHFMCMVISELCEAVQADRIGRRGDLCKFESVIKGITDLPVEFYERWNGICLRMNVPDYRSLFEKYIKDSIEDELADAVIRILDFCGLRGFELLRIRETKSDKRLLFTQRVYEIIRYITEYIPGRYTCSKTISLIFTLADDLNIDLMQFIRLKIAYNVNREYKHGGKNY